MVKKVKEKRAKKKWFSVLAPAIFNQKPLPDITASIYQRFDLDEEEIEKLTEKDTLDFPTAKETLVQKLLEQGFEVLECSNYKYGLPVSILVGGQKEIKETFFKIAEELNLKYKSEVWYGLRATKGEEDTKVRITGFHVRDELDA